MEYWAAGEDAAAIAKAADDRGRTWYKYLRTSGRSELLHEVFEQYYSGALHHGQIERAGEEGELSIFRINHYKTNLNKLEAIIQGTRPAFQVKATNSDTSSLEQSRICNDLAEFYFRERGLEAMDKRMDGIAMRTGEAWILGEWDRFAGDEYGVDTVTGKVVYTGDPVFHLFSSIDVIRDVNERRIEDPEWLIFRRYASKHDLSARYPEQAQAIQATTSRWSPERRLSAYNWINDGQTDVIQFFEMYHKATAAVDGGFRLAFLEGGQVLEMERFLEAPLKMIPAAVCAPEWMDECPMGYSWAFDMLSPQRMMNSMYSIAASNARQFGIQKMVGSEVPEYEEIKKNFVMLLMNEGERPPQPLSFPTTPPEIYQFAQQMVQQMPALAGLNAVTAGDIESIRQMPGNAMALLESTTIRYASSFQGSKTRCREKYMTINFDLLKRYAKTERIIAISGKDNRPYTRSWKADDIKGFAGIQVDIGNPVENTISGRVSKAQELLKAGLVKSATEYLILRETGRLDVFTSPESDEALLIEAENDQIRQGINPPASAVDNHPLHIARNRQPIMNVEARRDPVLVEAATAHLLSHISLMRSPEAADLLQVLGVQPIPPKAPTGIPAPIPGQTDGAAPAENMPTNPVTGQEFDQQTGGGMVPPPQ
jgi:hypothetical protein